MEKYFLIISAMLTALSVAILIFSRFRVRKTMTALSSLLDKAIDGSFRETDFDETMYSALESRLSRFLNQSYISSKSLTTERDKIRELISDISHQTKTPIANIMLYSQLLGESSLPEASARQVQFIMNQSEKLNFLIASLVKLSRLETGIISVNPRKNNVGSLIDSVLENIYPKASVKKINISFSHIDSTAVFDYKWTAEAVYNIIDNAVKYTPSGGSIKIDITDYEMFCAVNVTDSGIGIDEEELGKIFSRFYRGRNAVYEEGVGIGLFLSREILSAEKGYIKVKSKIGQGSSFSVFLPK